MKEIKFRAYNNATSKMMSWEFISKFRNLQKLMCLNHVEVMQFTGLKDKNGVEIYEGDYLVDSYPIDDEDLTKGNNESLLPIVWCEKQLMWCVDASFKKDGSYLTSLVEYFGEFLEVRGNIFENE